ncbi:hypothetical protein [Streptomyces sp. TS71-3]|uniref:hypothetical protein n=1 Tax=Streptomyces sp. TS71-3 TaxID=2733862 RepID=UPI001B2C9428|nr:hypothetical protein [Streptomyces sp. TS71-3]GHJ38145.1 hypothetical protein Sm713_37540 [Streptomyces sp. TS71-3]
MTDTQNRAQIGDLVRDTERSCEGIVTDVRAGKPVLRPRWGGGFTGQWSAEWGSLAVVSRRGTWDVPWLLP